MKHLTTLLFLILCLSGCTQRNMNQVKDVSYLDYPSKTLQSIHYFPVPKSGDRPILVTYKPIIGDNLLYFPVYSSYMVGTQFQHNTTIYALDPKTLTVKDSLDFNGKGKSCKFTNLLLGENIYVIGVKDSSCIIYSTDKNLKIQKEYDTGIKTGLVLYAGMLNNNIRLVYTDKKDNAVLCDLNAGLKPATEKVIYEKTYRNKVHNNDLWFFESKDKTIKTTRYDLSLSVPTPITDTYNIEITKDSMGKNTFRYIITDNSLYFSFSRIKPEGGFTSRLISYDLISKVIHTKDIDGTFNFDILDRDGKTYLFGIEKRGDIEAFMITQIDKNLTFDKKKISFYFTDSSIAQNIVSLNDKDVLLTGSYMLTTGKKVSVAMPKGRKAKVDETLFPVFMAKYELE
jgi:hypothetical protein